MAVLPLPPSTANGRVAVSSGRRTERVGGVSRRQSPRRQVVTDTAWEQPDALTAPALIAPALPMDAQMVGNMDATRGLTHRDILDRVCAQLDLASPMELIPFSIRVSKLLAFGDKLQSFVHEVRALAGGESDEAGKKTRRSINRRHVYTAD